MGHEAPTATVTILLAGARGRSEEAGVTTSEESDAAVRVEESASGGGDGLAALAQLGMALARAIAQRLRQPHRL